MSTGLVLVDIQRDYFPDGRMELEGMEQATARAAQLLRLFRADGRPVFHVQHLSTQKSAGFFLPDTAGVEIHDAVQPIADEVVVQKHFPNSFRETLLETELNKAEVSRLVICGAMSHMCIDATTRAAADLGYSCTVIADACATRDLVFDEWRVSAADVHAAFMAALNGVYAQVVNLEAYLAEVPVHPRN